MTEKEARTANISIAASGAGRYKISHLLQYLPVDSVVEGD